MAKFTKSKICERVQNQIKKQILDERLSNYFKNPSDVTDWDTFMKEVKNTIK